MAVTATVPFLAQFAALRDPRQAGKVLYPLSETAAPAAVLHGGRPRQRLGKRSRDPSQRRA